MATVLDLAREVRHRLVTGDTGCLSVDYTGATVNIHFSEGAIASERAEFCACFMQQPLNFQFKAMEVRNPGKSGYGASLLIAAIDGIDLKFMIEIWKSYGEWKIRFREDPEFHNTSVKEHLCGVAGNSQQLQQLHRLQKLMRLTVSGSITLEPPKILITDEMDQIEEHYRAGNWRKVLGVDSSIKESELKKSYRKLARRFHPDRWVTSSDLRMRDKIERTFQRVSHAYAELQSPHPIMPQLLIGHKLKPSLWGRMSGLLRAR